DFLTYSDTTTSPSKITFDIPFIPREFNVYSESWIEAVIDGMKQLNREKEQKLLSDPTFGNIHAYLCSNNPDCLIKVKINEVDREVPVNGAAFIYLYDQILPEDICYEFNGDGLSNKEIQSILDLFEEFLTTRMLKDLTIKEAQIFDQFLQNV